MLKDAPIVILDEATAYVDPENEILIQEAINSLVRSKLMLAGIELGVFNQLSEPRTT